MKEERAEAAEKAREEKEARMKARKAKMKTTSLQLPREITHDEISDAEPPIKTGAENDSRPSSPRDKRKLSKHPASPDQARG